MKSRLSTSTGGLTLALCAWVGAALAAPAADAPRNFFANPGFEMGREGWTPAKAGKTECRFTVEESDTAEGQHCGLLTLGAVEQWGVQFGQNFAAGEKGKTYTFAAFAKSMKGPVEASLQIERNANPWDRAATTGELKLTQEWQEFHVTFTLEKDFSPGWFAYLNCIQPNAQVRVDMFRLYEGPYVPLREFARQEIAEMAVRVFDTGAPSLAPLRAEGLSARAGWAEVPEDTLAHAFKGATVLMSDRLALALRTGSSGAEVYSLKPGGAALRTVLAPVSAGSQTALVECKIVENNPAAAVVDASFASPGGKTLTLRYELKVGQPFVQTEARANVKSLRVEAPCRFAIMPDFFADDIVVDAADLPVATAELPSDNFLLHLLPDHQAMVMTVTQSREQDIRVQLAGDGTNRTITSSELPFGKEGKIWVGVLAAPSIWHQEAISTNQAGQVMALDWKTPFPAQWRVDWRRVENLTDSWEVLLERPDGNFAKHSVYGGPDTIPSNRNRWTTVLGTFKYPAWVDKSGQAYLQPLKSSALRFEGPALIYPMSRVPATALDTFTVVDLVRNTLGVGPCEYVLDVEGQQSAYKGRATCSTRDTLNPIYVRHEQKQRRAEIEKVLQDVMIFIRHIRSRIEGYVDFGHQTLAYLEQQKKAHPEMAGGLAELESLAGVIDAKVAARKDPIKTPDQAADMVAEFRKTVLDNESEDAPALCKRFTEAWVDIGGNQDELAGECRWAVKMIRQRAGLLMATDPRLAETAKEIRRRSQVILRNPAGHEGARH